MGEEDNTQLQVATDTFTTPLRGAVLEIHEIFEELEAVGFNESMCSQIVAHMLTETILYSDQYVIIDEDEDEDGDDDLDGTDA